MKKIFSFVFAIIFFFALATVVNINAAGAMTAEIGYQYNNDNSAIRLVGTIKNINNVSDITDAHYVLTLNGVEKTEEITTVYETVTGIDGGSYSTKTAGVYYTVLKLTDINDSRIAGQTFKFKLVVNNSIESDEKSVTFGSPASNTISITDYSGSFEEAYLEWTPLTGVTDYNVYYKAQSASSYTAIDKMLIREYPTYYRADVLGLAAGDYTLKVVGVDASHNEIASSAATCNVTVTNYDRSGFTFSSVSSLSGGVGAYNLDGTLKNNAKVIYVTEANKSTLKVTIKSTEYTGVAAITQQIKTKNTSDPYVIRIIGKVTGTDMVCSDLTSWYALGVKNAANVTIEGIGEDATLYGIGVGFCQCNSVEVRNLGFVNWGGGQDGDGISLQETENCWIHNNDVFYGDAGGDADQAKGDGSCDLKNDSKYVTISYNHFYDSGKMSLCGMKSENGENYITYHHNWFDHSDSRHPRVRTMSVHVYNNYYDGNAKYGMGTAYGANIFSESNYFRYCKKPYLIGGQGSDTELSGEQGSVIKAYNDYIQSCSACIEYTPGCGTNFDVYVASSRNEVIPASVTTIGGYSYNNFDTTVDLGVNPANIDTPEQAKNKVIAYSGRINGGDISYAFPQSEDTNYTVITELKTMLNNYQSQLVRTIGDNATISSGSGSGSGETGGEENPQIPDTPIPGTTHVIYFDNEIYDADVFFRVFVNGYGSVDPYTFNGTVSITKPLKLNSSSQVEFTLTSTTEVTMVIQCRESGGSVKINSDIYDVTEDIQELKVTLDAGTYILKKNNKESFLYGIIVG